MLLCSESRICGENVSDLTERAMKFAIFHHRSIDQRRKYSNEPYEVHPIAVAAIVRSVGGTDEMIAASFLHDSAEDTNATIDDILREFGPLVASYVDGLTNVATKSDGNRAARRKINDTHTAIQCPEVKTIKLADCIHNVSDILKQDAKFALVYLQEKRDLLPYLIEGDERLYIRLEAMLEEN